MVRAFCGSRRGFLLGELCAFLTRIAFILFVWMILNTVGITIMAITVNNLFSPAFRSGVYLRECRHRLNLNLAINELRLLLQFTFPIRQGTRFYQTIRPWLLVLWKTKKSYIQNIRYLGKSVVLCKQCCSGLPVHLGNFRLSFPVFQLHYDVSRFSFARHLSLKNFHQQVKNPHSVLSGNFP